MHANHQQTENRFNMNGKDSKHKHNAGNNPTEDKNSSFIQRSPGQHRKVSAVIKRRVWHVDALDLSHKMEATEMKQVIRNEAEVERKRKMSAPYGASVEITDIQFYERCRRLSNVHEDLFKLFSIHNAVVQRKFEQQRLVTEVKKQLVLEELQRKSAQKAVKYAVEVERERRIKLLQDMAEGKSDHALEIADTNARLSKVHDELKNAFKYIWEKEAQEQQDRLKRISNAKRDVIDVASIATETSTLEDLEKKKHKEEDSLQATEQFRKMVQDKLIGIQEELSSIFNTFKRRMKLRADQAKEITQNHYVMDEDTKP